MRDTKRDSVGRALLRLTARGVMAARGNGRFQRLPDGNGLYLQVSPTGSKSWVLRTVVQGHRRDIGLGSLSHTKLADARAEAARLRGIARRGGNPLAQRQAERRHTPAFEEAARTVHELHAAAFRNQKHRKQWLTSLGPTFDAFGDRPLDTISSTQLLSTLTPLWLSKPETARRILQRLRTVFDWGKAQGYLVGDNPTSGLARALPRHRQSKRHHPALPFAELPAFLLALRASDSSETVRLALEFTILCATRTAETLNATWAEINVQGLVWTIPGSRMKVGVEHRVPLTARCLEILDRLRSIHGDTAFVFPGRTPKRPLSNMALLMAIRRMGHRDVTTHGFRSTFKDWASERTNTPNAVSEAALAHTVKDKAEAAYRRTDLFERRRLLMAAWADFALAAEVTPPREAHQ